MTTTRKFAHLVTILCVAAQMAMFSLEFHHWLPITNVWNADMIATLVAVVGSVYAGVKANRWWFVLTGIEALIAILLAVALGG